MEYFLDGQPRGRVEAFSVEEKMLREMVAMKCGIALGGAAEQFAAS